MLLIAVNCMLADGSDPVKLSSHINYIYYELCTRFEGRSKTIYG